MTDGSSSLRIVDMQTTSHDDEPLARAVLVAVHRVSHDQSGVWCEVDVDLQQPGVDPRIVRRRLRLSPPPAEITVGSELVVRVPPGPDADLIAEPS
jgi:hypothetical protein